MAGDRAPEITLRYFAASRQVYATALLALAVYARTHPEDFSIGPAALASLEHSGLTVTGPALTGVRAALAEVPGLSEQP